MEILQDLCLNLGERPTGSENNHKAQEYVIRIFERQRYQVEHQLPSTNLVLKLESTRTPSTAANVIARSQPTSAMDAFNHHW